MAQVPAVIPPRVPELVDSQGRPMRIADVLREEQAGPTIRGVRSIITGHPADNQTPQRLAALLRQSEDGRDPEAYLELAEQMEERDLHYVSVLGTRKRAVSQLPLRIDAASEDPRHQEHAELTRRAVKRARLKGSLFDLQDGVGKGFAVVEMMWDTGRTPWMPVTLEFRDPRFFGFADDGKTVMLRDDGGQLKPLDRYKYIVHRAGSKSGLPIRGGIARPVAWAYLFKNYAIKDWVAFAEIFGLPFRFGRYENGATNEDIAKLMRAVADIGSDAAAVFPKSMEIQFLDGKTNAGPDLYLKLAEYLDRQISKAVLGQTATTDSEGGGLGGSGKQHGDVRDDIRDADAEALAATLERDFVRPLIDLNFGPQDEYPTVYIGEDEAEDLKALTVTVDMAVRLGVRISEAHFRDRLGFPEPAAGERILGVVPDPAATPAAVAAPQAPGAPVRQLPRQNPGTAALTASYGLSAADLAAQPGDDIIAAAAVDVIDGFSARTGGDWEPLPDPLLGPVEALLAKAASLEDARDRLTELLAGDDGGKITEQLARGLFGVRLAALVGAPIGES